MPILYIIFFIYFTNNFDCFLSVGDGFRLKGGFNCGITKHPFIVSVIRPIFCSGSLITLEWVLTAAHCIAPEVIGIENVKVRAGFNSDTKYIQQRTGRKNIIHQKYNNDLMYSAKEIRYDIGLILLDEPFLRSPVAQPGQLPKLGFTKNCKTIRTAGIGKTYPNENLDDAEEIVDRRLKCVDLKIVSRHNCSTYYNATVDDTLICTLGPIGKDTCSGDSGGPIFCKNVIIGIISSGHEICDGNGEPGTNTKIESYLNFIWKNVNTSTLVPEKNTGIFNFRQKYSTSTSRTSMASGSCHLQKSVWECYWNIILFTIFLYRQ